MLSHDSLENLYKTEFALVQHHQWRLSEIENLLPFELDVFAQMLIQFLKEQEEALKAQEKSHK